MFNGKEGEEGCEEGPEEDHDEVIPALGKELGEAPRFCRGAFLFLGAEGP